MASSEEFPGFKIGDLTPKERFSVYVKTGWLIFSVAVQEINEIALDKKAAKPKYSKNVGEGVDTTVQAAGIIAGLFSPIPIPRHASKAIGKVSKTAVEVTGGALEKHQQHVSAMDIHKIIGSFDAENPKSYEPVISAFSEIFVHFNIQFIHLLDAEKLDCHLNKAMYKLALDSVSKIFHGLKDSLEKKEKLPNEFSATFLINCFLKGKSKGSFFDKIKEKLGGKSRGGKLMHSESKNNFSTEDFFETPSVKAKDGKIYSSTSSADTNKLLYRYLLPNEDLENHTNCYHKVFDRLPTFDEKNDQFIEMSRIKEEIIKEITKHMKNLVEKMDEVNNMLLAEINDIKDKFDAKFDQIGSQIDQSKDVILAQVNANQMKSDANDEKILAEIMSLKLKLEPKIYTVALGNPGSGKSTVLNSLAGELFFKSGLSIGSGLTSKLDEGSNKNGVFLDTPGLADEKLRTVAGKAIYQALKKDGDYRILFFVTARNGRVVQQDATTIKLVLDTAPDIGQDYGIIVNMLSNGVLKKMKKMEEKEDFLNSLFSGISPERRCPYNSVLYLGKLQELKGKNNELVSSDIFKNEEGMTLTEFVNKVVPAVNIKKQSVYEMKLQDFDKVNRDLETLAKEMQEKDLAWKEERHQYEEEKMKKATQDQIKRQELKEEMEKEIEILEALRMKQEN